MPREAFLGLDVGGTGAKAGIFDLRGRCLGSGRVRYQPRTWPDGRVEIPIGVIEEAARGAVRQAARGVRARMVALSVSSQGQTFVSLDDRGRPLHPAIIWYDGRAKAEAAEMARRGVPIETISSAAKVLWLRARDGTRMARARRHLLLPDYLAYRLTGRAVTDPTTAFSGGWVGVDPMAYDASRLAATGVSREALAEIQWPGTPIGPVLPEMARRWGISEGAMLVAGTNDQFAGALGAGNVEPGVLSVTTGTCLALVTLAAKLPDPPPPGLLHGLFPVKPWLFALTYSRTAGIAFDGFRRDFLGGATPSDADRRAARVPAGSGGVIALPDFEGMVSPEPNPWARGAFLGLGLHHRPLHLYRALLESLCFALRENVEFMAGLGLRPGVTRAIGGRAESAFWVQMEADVLGSPVEQVAVTEAATLGAAVLAAAGVGAFASVAEAAKAFYRCRRIFEPRPSVAAVYAPIYQRFRALRRAVHGAAPFD